MDPRYPHDCPKCRFLGTTSYVDPWSKATVDADLYFCPGGTSAHAGTVLANGTVLARVGHEDSEYASSPISLVLDRKPPFSTHGLALYFAAVIVMNEHVERCPECRNPVVAHKPDCTRGRIDPKPKG